MRQDHKSLQGLNEVTNQSSLKFSHFNSLTLLRFPHRLFINSKYQNLNIKGKKTYKNLMNTYLHSVQC